MNGALEEIIEALITEDQKRKLMVEEDAQTKYYLSKLWQSSSKN